MNYGCASIRFDMGEEARIRVCQYFSIPGTLSPADIVKSPPFSNIVILSAHVYSRYLLSTGCLPIAHTTMEKLIWWYVYSIVLPTQLLHFGLSIERPMGDHSALLCSGCCYEGILLKGILNRTSYLLPISNKSDAYLSLLLLWPRSWSVHCDFSFPALSHSPISDWPLFTRIHIRLQGRASLLSWQFK